MMPKWKPDSHDPTNNSRQDHDRNSQHRLIWKLGLAWWWKPQAYAWTIMADGLWQKWRHSWLTMVGHDCQVGHRTGTPDTFLKTYLSRFTWWTSTSEYMWEGRPLSFPRFWFLSGWPEEKDSIDPINLCLSFAYVPIINRPNRPPLVPFHSLM